MSKFFFPARRLYKAVAAILFIIQIPVCSTYGEEGFPVSLSFQDRRKALAENFERYDFEPRPTHLHSRDSDNDKFPDFWRRLTGPRYPQYEKITLTQDPSRQSLDPAIPGTVLYMSFSGENVGVETIYPKRIDPQLAYEITGYVRTEGLDNSIVSIDITWLNIDNSGKVEILGESDRIVIPPGQRDWPEGPFGRRINNLNRNATHVRLSCSITDDPAIPGADRHGEAWFDDISIKSRPKIRVDSVFLDTDKPLSFSIHYQGLIPNVEANDGSGKFTGKRYYRRIDIQDMNGDHPDPVIEGIRNLDPRNSTTYREEMQPALYKLGIYYVHVTLYGADNQPQAEVTQVVGKWQPPRIKPKSQKNSAFLDHLGVNFNMFTPANLDLNHSFLDVINHSGVFRAKMELWPEDIDELQSETLAWKLPDFLRQLRSNGQRITGTFGQMPAELIPQDGMLAAMRDRLSVLRELLFPVITLTGTQIDDWQWGPDNDTSFSNLERNLHVEPARKELQELTSAFNQALPLVLGKAKSIPELLSAESVNIYVPAGQDEDVMINNLAKLLPMKFYDMTRWEREIFPSAQIVELANEYGRTVEHEAKPLNDDNERRQQNWMTIQLLQVDPHLREVARERAQAIDFSRKVILGRALAFDRILAGSLTSPARGMAAVTRDGKVVPRPALLALRTLSEYMSGTEYLGSFQLGADVENYIFRTMRNTALMAIWYTGSGQNSEVDIGTGLGDLKQVDMAGNVSRPRRKLLVTHMPLLIDGISVPLARTRMSIRIAPQPPLMSRSEPQSQALIVRNFFTEPLIGTFRLKFAAYADADSRIRLEPGWTNPSVIRMNLPPGGEEFVKRVEGKRMFDVRPPKEAVLGRKFVLVESQLASALDTRFNLLRTTNLTSDMRVRVLPVTTSNRAQMVARLSIVWLPDPQKQNPPKLELRPYYQVAGEQYVYQGTVNVYPTTPEKGWSEAALRDIRIPAVFRNRRIWVGADDESGSRFIREEITEMLSEENQ